MTVEGLKQSIIAQGSSRSVIHMEWDKIWATNKKIIDPIAPRYIALDRKGTALVHIQDAEESKSFVSLHPTKRDMGSKEVWLSNQVLIELADVDAMNPGENSTFVNLGNVRIVSIHRGADGVRVEAHLNLEDKNYRRTPKLTWLAVTEEAKLVPCKCVYFDHLITKPVLAKDDDIEQFINSNTRVNLFLFNLNC